MGVGAGKKGNKTSSDVSEVHYFMIGPPIAGIGFEVLSPRFSW